MPQYKERRKHLRIPMVSIIGMSLDGDEAESPCMLVDLSAGGARILSQYRLAVGRKIKLSIPISDSEKIETIGNIVWVKEMELMKEYNFGVEYMGGVQFISVNEQIKHFITGYMGK